jgi:Ca2+-dependent lipid-binding protein
MDTLGKYIGKYLINEFNGKRVKIADVKTVTYKAMQKQVDSITVKGFGTMPVMELTGEVDQGTITVHTGYYNYNMPANQDGVNNKVRRLRTADARKIEKIEDEIRNLEQQKKELITQAFQRGLVVPVTKLKKMIKDGK